MRSFASAALAVAPMLTMLGALCPISDSESTIAD